MSTVGELDTYCVAESGAKSLQVSTKFYARYHYYNSLFYQELSPIG
jgi:hypothetical protein